MKLLHLGCSDDIRPGFDNLDPIINGWTFQSGLPYADDSVDGITISHALMYVPELEWYPVLTEFHRVLHKFGVVRITEDDCESPHSGRYNKPYPGAAVRTGPYMATRILREVGFFAEMCNAKETRFMDESLLISHRENKQPRYVFYVEGVKR